MHVPSVYRSGYNKASALNPEVAAKYVQHATIGDPLADAAIEATAQFDLEEGHRFIKAGVAQDAIAPQALRDFFHHLETPPSWFDPGSVRTGCLAFRNDSDPFLLAFLGDVIVRGFSALIGKSFLMTGRLRDYGVRRLHRNILHHRNHDSGWSRPSRGRVEAVRPHAARSRPAEAVLASIRQWNEIVFGTPMSAAHNALAAAGFSAQLLRSARRLGARPNADPIFRRAWRSHCDR
jgi:hypothetical protein